MLRAPKLDAASETPLYRQLSDFIRSEIESGVLTHGERLPATRELSIQIGLNRTTVSAAYAILESEGLIRGHVGRGSFVHYRIPQPEPGVDAPISFASSRPAEHEFPLDEFQATVREVLAAPELPELLQLGSPAGYAPLRQYLLDSARREGTARPGDDVLITSGCQQALDLVQRVLAPGGSTVAIEDPVYHGVKNVFSRPGLRLTPLSPGDPQPAEPAALAVLTPNFQNPTGVTMPLAAREHFLAAHSGHILENDIYGSLRYAGSTLPTLKQLDTRDRTLLVRSFSKIAFPGLRIGWIVGPHALISALAEAKQWCDLHTDQLSQAVLLRFAESGRLAAHEERVRVLGRERLRAVLAACERYLPRGSSWTRPEGGMSLWVRLPAPLDAAAILGTAEKLGVTYLPGRHFAVANAEPGSLRLSFGGLSPDRIEAGLERLGRACRMAMESERSAPAVSAAPAVV